jgi:hypothetical protein
MKNLIIGGISNYTYDHVKYWINSIKKTEFDGDIVLVATNILDEEIKKIKSAGVIVVPYGNKNYRGDYENVAPTAPHVERFLQIWKYLSASENYNYVVCTDVRDVIFQLNPVLYLKELFKQNNVTEALVASGEGLKYKDEPWGNDNFLAAFDPDVYSRIRHSEIFNVGVIAGTHNLVRDMLIAIYQLSINRRINIVDQAVYNFIINLSFCTRNTLLLSNNSGWATNLGTTIHAIKSGAGDIGKKNDPTSLILYQTRYLVDQPEIIDGIVYSSYTKMPSVIVHQYDRVAGLVDLIKGKFENDK